MSLDRALNVLITAAALAVAFVLIRRELSPRQEVAEDASTPTFVPSWKGLAAAGRLIGDPNAPVQIVEFSDFECPFCRRFNNAYNRVKAKYPREIALSYVHLPLPTHRFALPAARASECAANAGRFAPMVDAIYSVQDSLGLTTWETIAERAGVSDKVAFSACIADTAPLPQVEAGIAAATKVGVRATPTVFVNGWRFGGTPSEAMLDSLVRLALAGKQLGSTP